MSGIAEVGATGVELKEHQCSIKKITVSTEWKAPIEDDSETVSATVYDSTTEGDEKTIYLISSPEGKTVTIKTEREEGECQRESHKKNQMSWTDYMKEDTEGEKKEKKDNQSDNSYSRKESKFNIDGLALATAKDAALSSLLPVLLPINLIRTPIKLEQEIKNESEVKIKCFEIGGVFEALKYWKFPVPLEKKYITKFTHLSCKDGPIHYQIISYPDISFKLEFTIGTKEAKKKNNGHSHFERQTKSIKYLPERFKALVEEAPSVALTITPPSFTASTTYNGGKDELKVDIDFDSDNELFHFKYKHDSFETEFGSELLQDIPKTLKKIGDLCKLLDKLCNVEKSLKDIGISLIKNYKPYKLKLNPPSVSLSVEGKYQTSRDLTIIGKFFDIICAFEPLVSISLTVDLLFLLISAAFPGAGTGVYVMLKNFDKVVGKLFGNTYKKKYKDTKPFSADIFFDFVVTGAIYGKMHWIVDTTEERNANSNSGLIEGVLKVDLKAGAKASINVYYVLATDGEISSSASSGISFNLGLKNRILQGDGLAVLFETIFLGLKIKYCVKGKVCLFKIFSFGGSWADGEIVILEKTKIDLFSTEIIFLKDDEKKTGSFGKGSAGGGFGGGGGGGRFGGGGEEGNGDQ